eukprot:g59025.t1
MYIHNTAEKRARFEEEFHRQTRRHGFNITADFDHLEETEDDRIALQEYAEAKEMSKEKQEEIRKGAFEKLKDHSAEELIEYLKDLDRKVKRQEASAQDKIEAGLGHTLKHFRGETDNVEWRQKREELDYDSLMHAHTNKGVLVQNARYFNSAFSAEHVLVSERNRLRANEFASLPDTQLSYLAAASTLHAFSVLGINNAPEGGGMFSREDVIKKRKEILECTNRAARASGTGKIADDHAHEPLAGLRRSFAYSFGGKIEGMRSKKKKGRDKRDMFVIKPDERMVELATISNLFKNNNQAYTVPPMPKELTKLEPPRKKQRKPV